MGGGASARLTAAQHREAKRLLAARVDELSIVEAAELADGEARRGYGAIHLAAALAIETDVVTSADATLCDAAERRGVHVASPLDA